MIMVMQVAKMATRRMMMMMTMMLMIMTTTMLVMTMVTQAWCNVAVLARALQFGKLGFWVFGPCRRN